MFVYFAINPVTAYKTYNAIRYGALLFFLLMITLLYSYLLHIIESEAYQGAQYLKSTQVAAGREVRESSHKSVISRNVVPVHCCTRFHGVTIQ